MERRIILNSGDVLRLRRDQYTDAAEEWTITGFVGEGGACVCYSAQCGAKSGRLKEYYPLDEFGCPVYQRREDGSLLVCGARQEAMCGEFCRAYELLERTKQSDADAQLLNNFIPPYEMLWGEGGTVYIWTPDDKQGISFEQYLSEVRAQPEVSPEHKLYNIISTVSTLSDCIRVLHRAGLLHLDIKPSNFMVLYDGRFNINPSSISLFDVNTLYPMDSTNIHIAGTENYCAPEVKKGRGENRSDIYSLGMLLLRAIVFSDEGEPHSYEAADYDNLDALLAESPLIRASDANSNVFLRHSLACALKKCLAFRPSARYDCCEELIEELKRAETFLLPEVAGANLGLQKRLAVLDAEPQQDRSSGAVLRDLLFRCPPERNMLPGEKEINVLVLGAGTYGQKFMDICLQACQIPERRLNILALSQSPELDREVYLRLRPALSEFVDCCGSLKGRDSYARVDFYPESLRFERNGDNDEAFALLRRLCRSRKPHFVFISLGDDGLNRRVAERLAPLLTRGERRCAVHYVVQSGDECGESAAGCVYVNRAISAKAIDPRLEKWAFNTHLCWMGGENADLGLARKQFRQKYNYESSLSFALSIPSLLRSVGVDPDDPEKAAEDFGALLDDDIAIGKLAALEHRRWVLEKLCAGWRFPRRSDGSADLMRGLLRGDMRDQRRRTHPCIARSGETMPLKAFTPEMWAKPGDWDGQLDELDTVSVTLHRLCLERAEEIRHGAALGELSLLRRRITESGDSTEFEAYSACLQRLVEGERAAAGEFPVRENALKALLAGCDEQLRGEVGRRMEQIRKELFPLLWSLSYRDYKASDEALIRKLPFVLTYSPPRQKKAAAPEGKIVANEIAYVPRPISTEDIELPPRLLELGEKIAENVHDVWAAGRMAEGWVYGKYRDSELKTSPDLVPYDRLPETEKDYDRKTAMETLKLIIKLGYRIESGEQE